MDIMTYLFLSASTAASLGVYFFSGASTVSPWMLFGGLKECRSCCCASTVALLSLFCVSGDVLVCDVVLGMMIICMGVVSNSFVFVGGCVYGVGDGFFR